MSSSTNPLAADSLASIIISSLSGLPSPQVKTIYDAVAVAAHSSMLAVGFRLMGLGEDNNIEAHSDPAQPKPLPKEWNQSAPNYAFRYAHSQSSMEYLLKVSRMGSKAVIMGMAVGNDKTTTLDLAVKDYISESSIPADPAPDASSPTSSSVPSEQTVRRVTDLFISASRLGDFGSSMRLDIIQKLIPSLQKEGYEESSTESARAQPSSAQPSNRRDPAIPQHDLLREDYQPLARPRPFPAGEFAPPGFEDPYDLNRPPRPMPGQPNFGNIGERDLYPQGLGPRDGIWGGIGPGLDRGFGAGGGGMHPTFDDPLFAGPRGPQNGMYDPQAPPGSRYDPVGPGGAPRGSGFGGAPGGGPGSRPHNPFGGFGGGDFI